MAKVPLDLAISSSIPDYETFLLTSPPSFPSTNREGGGVFKTPNRKELDLDYYSHRYVANSDTGAGSVTGSDELMELRAKQVIIIYNNNSCNNNNCNNNKI